MAAGLTLVTGGTGFLGRHVLDRLRERQTGPIRVLTTRAPDWLRAMRGVEFVEGSILDPAACSAAAAHAVSIIHLAGMVSRDPDDAVKMYELHLTGTRRLIEAAKGAGAKRLVLVSSSGTYAVSESADDLPDETTIRPLALITKWPYYLSKYYEERTAKDLCDRYAIELVTVHPSLVLGPGDDRLSSTVDIQRFLDGHMPLMPPGGLNFVDARDAAATIVTAIDKGRQGEAYLAGAENWTCRKFFERVGDMAKKPAPLVTASARVMRAAGVTLDFAYRKILGRTPPVDKASAAYGTYFWYFDDAKARRELGHIHREPAETIHDTVAYLTRGSRTAAAGRAW